MIKKLISGAFFALLLAAGLFLPDIIAKISDLRIETDPVYTAFCPAEEFSYIGTPEDKLRALTHYENMSVDYKMTPKTDWQTVKTLPEGVQALFPDLGSGEIRERTFTLTHKSVAVHFTYTETELHALGGSARIVSDPEAGRILLVSVTGAKEALQNWENVRNYDAEGFLSVPGIDAYALLNTFAALNGFTEITDLTDGNSYGGSVSTVKADVKGRPFSLCVTFSEQAGTIYYRLIALEGE